VYIYWVFIHDGGLAGCRAVNYANSNLGVFFGEKPVLAEYQESESYSHWVCLGPTSTIKVVVAVFACWQDAWP